jgi:hypothetical protein
MGDDGVKSLCELLNQSKLTLLYSLPRNDPKLAEAALAGGADVIKVHINVAHRASGTKFGTLEEERAALEEILRLAGDRPVGIVPKGEGIVTAEDLLPLKAMGFSFSSAYAHHYAPEVLSFEGMEIMAAPDYTYAVEELAYWNAWGVDILEASVIEPRGYGEPLSLRDVSRYARLAELGMPVVVPTQRKISPENVPALVQAGVKGLMLGAVVTGKEQEQVRGIIAEFREAVDAL